MPNAFDNFKGREPSTEQARLSTALSMTANAFDNFKERTPTQTEVNKVKFNNKRKTRSDLQAEREAGGYERAKVTAKKLKDAWDGLPEDEKQGIIANHPYSAGVIKFVDEFLPFPLVMHILTDLSPETAAKFKHAIEANPEAAAEGAQAGSIAGLIGGIPALAKMLAKGISKLASKGVTSRAGTSSVGKAEKWQAGLKGNTATVKKSQDQLDKFADDLGHWELKDGVDASRELAVSAIRKMPADHPVKLALGGKADDIYQNLLNYRLRTPTKTGSWRTNLSSNIAHKAKQRLAKTAPWVAQAFIGIAAEETLNFWYSYEDWKSQGYSDLDSLTLAWSYVGDKTKTDLLINVGRDTLESIIGRAKFLGIPIGKIIVEGVSAGAKYNELKGDLTSEGKVSPSAYNKDVPTESHAGAVGVRQAVKQGNTEGWKNQGGTVGKGIMRPRYRANKVL